MIRRFIQFEKEWLIYCIDCFWGQMNIVGKIVFSPFTLVGLFFVPILLPIFYVVMKILTWKPFSDKPTGGNKTKEATNEKIR